MLCDGLIGGGDGREAQKGGDICIHGADSRYAAETNTTVTSNFCFCFLVTKSCPTLL